MFKKDYVLKKCFIKMFKTPLVLDIETIRFVSDNHVTRLRDLQYGKADIQVTFQNKT